MGDKRLNRTFISKNEKKTEHESKLSIDRIMLLFLSNASEYYMKKLILSYRWLITYKVKRINKNQLQVYWEVNSKAW